MYTTTDFLATGLLYSYGVGGCWRGYVKYLATTAPPRMYQGTDSLVGSMLVLEVDYIGRRQLRLHSSCAVLTESWLGVGIAIVGGCWGHCRGEMMGMESASASFIGGTWPERMLRAAAIYPGARATWHLLSTLILRWTRAGQLIPTICAIVS